MANQNDTGVFQMDNGCWGYRYKINIDGTLKEKRRRTDDMDKPFKTKASAIKARQQAIMNEKINAVAPTQIKIQRKTVKEVYNEYCEFGRSDKAYATIKKQDSLWNNHIKAKYGKRYIDDITVAEINDYLTELYYMDNRAYSYTESFLKLFYLIFGQAYSRNYLGAERYDKLCKNKDTKIHNSVNTRVRTVDTVLFLCPFTNRFDTHIVPKLKSYDTALCLTRNQGFVWCHFLWSKVNYTIQQRSLIL